MDERDSCGRNGWTAWNGGCFYGNMELIFIVNMILFVFIIGGSGRALCSCKRDFIENANLIDICRNSS